MSLSVVTQRRQSINLSRFKIFRSISLFITALIFTIPFSCANARTTIKLNPDGKTYSQVTVEVSLSVPRREDGAIDFEKWFAGKTPQEIKQLAKGLKDDKDYDSYLAWKENQNDEKRATIIAGETK